MTPKNSPGVTPFGSQNRPWRPRRLLDALWLLFGSLLVPFWFHFGSFDSIVMPFGSFLAPFGLLFCTFSLHFHDFSYFLNLFLLFIHLDCLRFRFWSHFECKCNFWAPNPAGNPQQSYRRISTVGTPPFLGPGRVCCRRQLKISDEIDLVLMTQ